MTVHEGNPAGARYPRPLRCQVCGDEWVHAPHDNERFTFVLELRGGVCRRCYNLAKHHADGRTEIVQPVQAEMELEAAG